VTLGSYKLMYLFSFSRSRVFLFWVSLSLPLLSGVQWILPVIGVFINICLPLHRSDL